MADLSHPVKSSGNNNAIYDVISSFLPVFSDRVPLASLGLTPSLWHRLRLVICERWYVNLPNSILTADLTAEKLRRMIIEMNLSAGAGCRGLVRDDDVLQQFDNYRAALIGIACNIAGDGGRILDVTDVLDLLLSGQSVGHHSAVLLDVNEWDFSGLGLEAVSNENDPQLCMLLQCCYQALEHASVGLQGVHNSSSCGVFVALPSSLIGCRSDLTVSNTLGNLLRTQGPSLTFCGINSPLVAVNCAIGSISCGECELAVVCVGDIHGLISDSNSYSGGVYGLVIQSISAARDSHNTIFAAISRNGMKNSIPPTDSCELVTFGGVDNHPHLLLDRGEQLLSQIDHSLLQEFFAIALSLHYLCNDKSQISSKPPFTLQKAFIIAKIGLPSGPTFFSSIAFERETQWHSNVQKHLPCSLHFLYISAPTFDAVEELSSHCSSIISESSDQMDEVCSRINSVSDSFRHQIAVYGSKRVEMLKRLSSADITTALLEQSQIKLCFLLPGQGSEYVGMASELYDSFPTFSVFVQEVVLVGKTVNGMPDILPVFDSRLLVNLADDFDQYLVHTASLHETCFAQVTLFCVEYAMCMALLTLGIVPDAIIGHSVGEIVACTVCGMISLKDGLMLVVERGRLMSRVRDIGKMVAINCSSVSALSMINEIRKHHHSELVLEISAVNGPFQTVVSGSNSAIDIFIAAAKVNRYATKYVNRRYGFHSPLMHGITAQLYDIAEKLSFNDGVYELISCIDGKVRKSISAGYVVEHLTGCVHFCSSVESALDCGVNYFVEVGPGSSLITLVQRISKQLPITKLSLMPKDGSSFTKHLNLIASLYSTRYLNMDILFPKKLFKWPAPKPFHHFDRNCNEHSKQFKRIKSELSFDHGNNFCQNVADTTKTILADDEVIAIVGMGCRFPCGANSISELWQMLKMGLSGITGAPRERFSGGMRMPIGTLSAPLWHFDPLFFNMSPLEAKFLDPQQRLLLTVAWECIENAGLTTRDLQTARCSVHVGSMEVEFNELISSNASEQHFLTGSISSALSGRLSHFFGLEGPSTTIDTACSSSLVALDDGIRTLREGIADMALVGGVSVVLSEAGLRRRKHVLSVSGKCHAFDAAADGYARGEGCGVILLQRIKRSELYNRRYHAILCKSLVSHDGLRSGMSVPNIDAQFQLVCNTVTSQPNDMLAKVCAVELHGTGTQVGDKVEFSAMKQVLNNSTQHLVYASTAKTTIGHCEGAAGLAGVIKLALSLSHQYQTVHGNYSVANPQIDMNQTSLTLPVVGADLEFEHEGCGTVSSFGITGTNCCALLQIPGVYHGITRPDRNTSYYTVPYILPMSAKTKSALQELVHRMSTFLLLTCQPATDICNSAVFCREKFAYRVSFIGRSIGELYKSIIFFNQHGLSEKITKARMEYNVTLFFGSGTHAMQWKSLFNLTPRFHDLALRTMCNLEQLLNMNSSSLNILSQNKLMHSDNGLIETLLTFCMQMSLAQYILEIGINPSSFLGSGVGCIAAAVFDGAISFQLAATIISNTMKIVDTLCGLGLIVPIQIVDVKTVVFSYLSKLHLIDCGLTTLIKCDNTGTYATVVAILHSSGIAFSSILRHNMPECSFKYIFEEVSASINIASVTNFSWQGSSSPTLKYFVLSLLEPSSLPLANTWNSNDIASFVGIGSLERCESELRAIFITCPNTLAQRLALLFCCGASIKWDLLYHQFGDHFSRCDIPNYPFACGEYWPVTIEKKEDECNATIMPLLPTELININLDECEFSYLGDHLIFGNIFLPAAYMVVTIVNVFRRAFCNEYICCEDVEFKLPCRLTKEKPTECIISRAAVATTFCSYDHFNKKPVTHLMCRLTIGSEPPVKFNIQEIKQESRVVPVALFYQCYCDMGIGFHISFRTIKHAWSRFPLSLAAVEVSAGNSYADLVHPTLLDGALQAVLIALYNAGFRLPYIPQSFNKVTFKNKAAYDAKYVIGEVLEVTDKTVRANCYLCDQSGVVLVSVEGLTAVALSRGNDTTHEVKGPSEKNTVIEDVLHADTKNDLLPASIEYGDIYELTWHQESYYHGYNDLEIEVGKTICLSDNPVQFGKKVLLLNWGKALQQLTELAKFENFLFIMYIPELTGFEFIEKNFTIMQRVVLFADILFIVKNAFYVTDGDIVNPYSRCLTGFVKSLAMEYPSRRLRLLDANAEVIWNHICAACSLKSTVAALRDDQYFIENIEKFDCYLPNSSPPSGRGTWLVTGGSKGIGLEIVKHLAKTGAQFIAVLSRTADEHHLKEISISHCKIVSYACDVSDWLSLSSITSKLPLLDGIVHSAGLLQDGSFQNMTWQKFSAVLRGKVVGAQNLHRYTLQYPVKHFILFSSVASLIGSRGQSNYAMANSFLDGLACFRKSLQLPALSINWGPWSDVGMAAGMNFVGIQGFDVIAGLRAFDVALKVSSLHTKAELVCCNFQWSELVQKFPHIAPLVKILLLQNVREPNNLQCPSQGNSKSISHLNSFNNTHQLVVQAVKDTLHFSADTELDDEAGFFELGLDSILLISLVNNLNSAFSPCVTFTESDLIDHRNVNSLVEHIALTVSKTRNPLSSELKLDNTVADTNNYSKVLHHEETSKFYNTNVMEINTDFNQMFYSEVTDGVLQDLRVVLHLSASYEVDVDTAFVDLGIDSILGIHLVNRLFQQFNIALSNIELLSCSTVRKLIELVVCKRELILYEASNSCGESIGNFADAVKGSPAPFTIKPTVTQHVEIEQFATKHLTESECCADLNAGLDIDMGQQLPSNDRDVFLLGVGVRFPGHNRDLSSFWDFLKTGKFAAPSMDMRFYPPSSCTSDTLHCMLSDSDVCKFDAGFFNISPNEAMYMDPQHRILLQVAHEAMESAGILPESLQHSMTGVYVGMASNDYASIITSRIKNDQLSPYMGPGLSRSGAAGRISHYYGFQGPAVTFDTACSSSQTALNYALEDLQTGRCQLAFVGGANVILDRNVSATLEKANVLSKAGICRTFDYAADGYVRAEGCCMMIVGFGDHLCGEVSTLRIKSCSVMHNGSTSGITVPSNTVQQRLINHSMVSQMGAQVTSVVIECHGTGTSLGDKLEVANLSTSLHVPCVLSSLKANVGHLEAAAGVSSMAKLLVCQKNQYIVSALHFEYSFSSTSHLKCGNHSIPIIGMDQNFDNGTPQIMNSFGFTGTNVCTLMDHVPVTQKYQHLMGYCPKCVLLSAKSRHSLLYLVDVFEQFLYETNYDIGQISTISQKGRSLYKHRLALPLHKSTRSFSHFAQSTVCQAIALVIPKTMKYPLAGIDLVLNLPIMYQYATDCCHKLAAIVCTPLMLQIFQILDRKIQLNDFDNILGAKAEALWQFVVQHSLVKVWLHWGVMPSLIAGSSIGLLAGLYALEVMDLDDVVYLILDADSSELKFSKKVVNMPMNIKLLLPSIHGAVKSCNVGDIARVMPYFPPCIDPAFLKIVSDCADHVLFIDFQDKLIYNTADSFHCEVQNPSTEVLEEDIINSTLADLFCLGIDLKWQLINECTLPDCSRYPLYQFDNHEHWVAFQPESRLGDSQMHSFSSVLSNKHHKQCSGTNFLLYKETILDICNDKLGLKLQIGDSSRGFFSLGIDSLTLMDLRNELLVEFGSAISISAAVMFEYPNIDALAGYLVTSIETMPNSFLQSSHIMAQSWSDCAEPNSLDIAIIGYSGTFSGSVDVDALWENLLCGRECIEFLPTEKLNSMGIPMPIYKHNDYVNASGRVHGIELFDPEFWKLSYSDALKIDPQVRLFVEHCFKALENGGCVNDRNKKRVGVYAGAEPSFYSSGDEKRDPYGSLNNMYFKNQHSFISMWTSHLLDLNGPAVSLFSACSTSLVCIAEACSALKQGSCNLALAGASSLVMPNEHGYIYEEDMVYSRDGHCRPFDACTSGIVRGSGCGVVLLKRLKDAINESDNIHGVIRSCVVNNDGVNKTSFAASSVGGQMNCIKDAIGSSNIDINDIGYVECHGTGTKLGDAVELNAMSRIFKSRTSKLHIGSIKANIGHCFAASGIASLIKVCKILETGLIPPQINFENFGAEVLQDNIEINKDKVQLNCGNIICGVSSFGIGGTNAHLLVQSHSSSQGRRPTSNLREPTDFKKVKVWPSLTSCNSPNKGDAASLAHAGQKLYTPAIQLVGNLSQFLLDGQTRGDKVTCILFGSHVVRQHLDLHLPPDTKLLCVEPNFGIENIMVDMKDTVLLNPNNPSSYDLLRRHIQAEGIVPTLFIHSWLLHMSVSGTDDLSLSLDLGYYSVYNFYTTFLLSAVSSVHIVVLLPSQNLNPTSCMVVNCCRVIVNETSKLKCRCLYLDPTHLTGEASTVESQWRGILQCLFKSFRDTFKNFKVLTLIGTEFYEERYCEIVASNMRNDDFNSPITSGDTVIVVGGLGHVGLNVIETLLNKCKLTFVIFCRSLSKLCSDTKLSKKLRTLQQSGCQIYIYTVDLLNLEDIGYNLKLVIGQCKVISGIIFSAGLATSDGAIKNLSDTAKLFAAKVYGTWNLLHALMNANICLKYFISMSSLSAAIGLPGAADYCAANAFLDGLTNQSCFVNVRRFLSVQWPTWFQSPMFKTYDTNKKSPNKQLSEFISLVGITDVEGQDLFSLFLTCSGTSNTACTISPMNPELLSFKLQQTLQGSHNSKVSLMTRCTGENENMEEIIIKCWKRILMADNLDSNSNFYELGGNSLSAIQLVTNLNEVLPTPISLSILVENPLLGQFCKMVSGGL